MPAPLELLSQREVVDAVRELKRREDEALRLFRPMPSQMGFFRSGAGQRLIRGGNRSGKTCAAAAAVASVLTQIPLTGCDEMPLPFRKIDYKAVVWVIGYDEKHIGRTIYRKLFDPGAFWVIKDKKTKALRAWKPWEPEDLERESERVPSPPLIPERLLASDSWGWEDRTTRVFSVCRLSNGNELYAFSSKAAAAMGTDVDMVWIDEDIHFPQHVGEWQARLADRQGKLIWSAWPHSKNDALVMMAKRAGEQKDLKEPDVFEVVLKFSANPYIPPKAKQERLADWAANGPDELRARDEGEFTFDSVLVFPNFSTDLHGVKIYESVPKGFRFQDKIDHALYENAYKIPPNWTHFLVLDPGTAHPYVLFAACPPPETGDFVVVYDEVVGRLDAMQIAKAVREKSSGRNYEAFLIDGQAGKMGAMGVGKSFSQIYSEGFEAEKLYSRNTGSGFIYGSSNIQSRNEIIRQWLTIRPDGTTKLKVLAEAVPNFVRQLGIYRRKVTPMDVSEDTVEKDCDACACLGYLAAFGPGYVHLDPSEAPVSPALARFRKWKESKGPKRGTVYCGAGVPETATTGAYQ